MDVFGNTDPKKMPKHFFWGAISLHYTTARRGRCEKQNYTVAPRHWYIDADFKCETCGTEFAWTAQEQQMWFEEYGFYVDSQPRHCPGCRAKRRGLATLQREYDEKVAQARNHGSVKQKERIVEIVGELEKNLRKVSARMTETKELFERQIRKAGQCAEPDV
jgi:hypothetical protein